MHRSSEHERIRLLRELFAEGSKRGPGVLTGIGDDAAVLAPSPLPVIASVDAHVEGVHFTRQLLTFEEIGYRATMAALSDLAAMGAEPAGVLAAITLPGTESDAALLAIARGQRGAAAACETEVVGGNLARGDAISIATTVLGYATRPVLRSGARDGDAVLLGGPVGLAAAGLRVAERGEPRTPAERMALAAFKRPLARISVGRLAALAGVTAMIDVSDGLAQDALHIARASGVDIAIDAKTLEDPMLDELAATFGCAPLDLVLHGGEDFALIATASDGVIPEGMRRIGRCRASASPAVLLVHANGEATPIEPRGFDHFAG